MGNKKKTVDENHYTERRNLRRELFDLIGDEETRDHIPKETLREMIRIAREGLKKIKRPKK